MLNRKPGIVEEKGRLGNWELDTITGFRKKRGNRSMVDRATKLWKNNARNAQLLF